MESYPSLLLSAVALGFAVAAPLGPTGTTAVRQGLATGASTAFWIGMGAALTDLAYITATYLGLTPLLLRLPWLTPLLYAVGALMLGRMGWGALRDAWRGASVPPPMAALVPAPVGGRSMGGAGWWSPLLLGISITIVNPATITSWLALGGAFVAAHLVGLPPLPTAGALLGILIGSAGWFTILAGIVAVARAYLDRLPWLFRAVTAGSGLILLGFALSFAWADVQLLLGG
jgi:threonine/homoserine/homoserine lactone efflux protein